MNIPLIEYTLEFLALSGVEEILIMCCAHANMIVDYINVGDALRKLDEKLREGDGNNSIQSDFILVSGDIVSNFNIQKALAEHRARRLVDKNAIMTMVPPLFTENFDYQDLRTDFVRGILTLNVLGKQFHCHIVSDKYAVRVRSTQMYDAISKDVLDRWPYPMVPDTNILDGSSYTYGPDHIYKEKDVLLARSTVLKSHVAIGAGTKVGENTTIERSVIGRSCTIGTGLRVETRCIDIRLGANVTLSGAYLWDNVTIGDNCTIMRSILADNVGVLAGVKMQRGCVVSFGVGKGDN
ncbi:hypothetical protein HK101_006506 [Irineochytrium annulatum]|nr:hypothetical protein HK101_006506 [Irineochytrium annulatum]